MKLSDLLTGRARISAAEQPEQPDNYIGRHRARVTVLAVPAPRPQNVPMPEWASATADI